MLLQRSEVLRHLNSTVRQQRKSLNRWVKVSAIDRQHDSSESSQSSGSVTEAHRESGRDTPAVITSLRVRVSGPVSGKGSTENAQTVRRPAGGLFGASRQPVRSARRPQRGQRDRWGRRPSLRGREVASGWSAGCNGFAGAKAPPSGGSSELTGGVGLSERVPMELGAGL